MDFLRELPIEAGSLLVGISLGGLVAAKLQETGREDLHVICISSPTWADGVELQHRLPHRVALYSSADEVIAGRTSRWPDLAEAHDLPWLSHDTDAHREALVRLIAPYILGEATAPSETRSPQQAFEIAKRKVFADHAGLFRRLAAHDRQEKDAKNK